MIERHYRSFTVELNKQRDADLLQCFWAMGLAAKNLVASTLFLLRQTLNSYRWEGTEAEYEYHQIPKLHVLQAEALNFINAHIHTYNKEQAAKRQKKMDAQLASLAMLRKEESTKRSK